MLGKYKNILIGVIVVVILYFGWTVLNKKEDPNNLLISSSGNKQVEVLGQPISNAISRISRLELSRGLFDNSVFLSLTKESRPIISEPVGKQNPFAPLDGSFSDSENININTSPSTTTKPAGTR